MTAATSKASKRKTKLKIVKEYDSPADSKNRISLRGATAKYFRVKAFSNGSYFLEPRVLVPPTALPSRVRRMLEKSVSNLKKGKASNPVDLSQFDLD
jgi:hypothetical protein